MTGDGPSTPEDSAVGVGVDGPVHLCSPSRSLEGGNEPSGRAQRAEIATSGPIPHREAGGPQDTKERHSGAALWKPNVPAGILTLCRCVYWLSVGYYPGKVCPLPVWERRKEARDGREAAARPLTCPPSEQLHPPSQQATIKGGIDVAKRFEVEIQGAIQRFGVEHVLVFTTTAGQKVGGKFRKIMEWSEASRRWDSLNSNLIALQGFVQWVKVMQRQKDGAVHYHVVVVCRHDVRGDMNFNRKKKRWDGTPSLALRVLWDTFSPEVMARYGFGVANILPVQDESGVGRYLARYCRREIGTRQKRDRGARLIQYSQSWSRIVAGPFCWADMRSQRATRRAEDIARRFWGSWDRMIWDVGSSWRFKLMRLLYASDDHFTILVSHIEEELKLYGGPMFILNDCLATMDRRKAEAAEWKRRFDEAHSASHVSRSLSGSTAETHAPEEVAS